MMASHNCYEPIELRRLKAKLASITCDCVSCDRKNCLVLPNVQLHRQVQVGEPRWKLKSLDRFTQANSETINNDQTALINTLYKDILCPSCFITMNLLRGGALKVVRDQSSTTNHDMFSSDKCIGKSTRAVERCTETNASNTHPKWRSSNNVSVYDDNLSESTFSESSICRPEKTPHSLCQVKFVDDDNEALSGNNTRECVCLDDFINSIRAPISAFSSRRRR